MIVLLQPQQKKTNVPSEIDEVMAEYKKRYPNIPDVVSQGPDEAYQLLSKDPNLDFQDEADAYSKFRSHGYFTPNPASGKFLCFLESQCF